MSFCKAFRRVLVLFILGIQPAFADPMLADFDYPFEVKRFEFTSQRLPLSMAYLDVAPQGAANGDTVVLLHGKNFCAATWEETIRTLSASRLSRCRPGSDRLLQIVEARTLSIQLSATRLQHAGVAAEDRRRTSDHHGAFDRRNARVALCPDVSARDKGAGCGQPHRA